MSRHGLPLAWRLIGATLVIVAGVSCVMGYQSFREDRQLMDQSLYRLGEHLVNSGASSCLEPLSGNDYAAVDTFVELLGQDEEVLYVRILRDGEVLSEVGNLGNLALDASHHSAPIELQIPGREPLYFGTLHLALSTAQTQAILSQRAKEILWVGLGSFALLAGILAGLLRRHLGRPLEVLDARTRGLSDGDFQTPVPQVGAAELGRLAGTLDHMRVSVRDTQDSLKARNRELVKIGAEKDTALANLTVALDRAQAAEQARKEFLANMSHELCTPLNGILGIADLLARDSKPGETLDLLHDVQHSGQEMLHLVRGVLDWSVIENDAVQLEQESFDLLEVFSEYVDRARLRALSKGLRLTCDVATEWEPMRMGDRARVGQIIGQLLDNAVKFTDKGEIICRLGADTSGEGILFEVLDTGPGLQGAHSDQWLEPFRQADGSTTRSHGGTGLGLAISSRLAKMMGGRLTLQGREKEGLAVTLTLPLTEITSEVDTPPSPSSEPLRVLVVDDNVVNRRLASVVVERAGHTAEQAEGGAQALRAFEAGAFDVVLMDVQMPGMDGFEATRKIRAIERTRGSARVSILAVTAGAFEGGEQRCRDAGMDGFLAKPVSYDRLLAAVEAAGASLTRIA